MSGAGTPPSDLERLRAEGWHCGKAFATGHCDEHPPLPTVERLLNEARAEGARQALHDAAGHFAAAPSWPGVQWLRDRAAAIPTTKETT